MILTPTADNLPLANAFLGEFMDGIACPPKTRIALETVLEEVYMNIANHSGATVAEITAAQEDGVITLCFSDNGIPYNPLLRGDPDITLPAESREIGGLGILMIRRMTDRQTYEHAEGRNVLTLYKRMA